MMASQPPADAPASTPAAESAEAFPWPPRPSVPLTEAAVRTWQESVFRPSAFFRSMPRAYRLRRALLYYLMVGILVEGIHLFWRFILGPPSFESLPGGAWLQSFDGGASALTGFLIAPFYLLIALFLTAAITHGILIIVRGANHGFRTTVAVFCFAYGPALFAIVPRVGMLIGGIWTLVLAIIGLREAHGTSGARAAVAVLGPAFLAIAITFVVLLMVMAGILARLSLSAG